MIRDLLAHVRQFRFPPEFRIGALSNAEGVLEGLDELISEWPNSVGTAVPQPNDRHHAEEDFLVRVATGVWRLRRRMLVPGSGEPKDEMRRAYRHLEFVWD